METIAHTKPAPNTLFSPSESRACALDEWHIEEDRRQEFIEAWKALYGLLEGLDRPPRGVGLLLQSAITPTLHYSLASWPTPADVKKMREAPAVRAQLTTLAGLCTTSACETFIVVADAPFGSFAGEPIYSYANWRANPGSEEQFIEAWKQIPKVFATLETPPVGIGHLYQSTADSTLFHSFGPWPSFEALEKMRSNPAVQAAIGKAAALCSAAAPAAFLVVGMRAPH